MLKKSYFISLKGYIIKLLKILYYPFLKIQFNGLTFKLFNLFMISDFSNSKKLFFTYHMRPKRNIYREGTFDPLNIYEGNEIGIIIQGGLKYEDEFTLETVKYYKSIYSNVRVVVSTWTDENEIVLNQIKEAGGDVITSPKPTVRGFGNNNLQILSTRMGIEYLDKLGIKYVLKTRTDQRIYYEKFIDYFMNLLKVFPVSSNVGIQEKRVIVLNIGTCIDIPFLITDMLQFGCIEDMKKMWFIPLLNKNIDEPLIKSKPFSAIDLKNAKASELYIIENFLKNIDADYEYSFKNHLEILKSRFIVVDKSNINLFWYKYHANEFLNFDYTKKYRAVRMNFSDWFNLYCSNTEYYRIDENRVHEIINGEK